jgi:hypothetical protein
MLGPRMAPSAASCLRARPQSGATRRETGLGSVQNQGEFLEADHRRTALFATRRAAMRHPRAWLLAMGLALLLPNCRLKPKVAAPGKSAAGATANCADWAAHMDGPYRYENDVWGHSKAQGGFEQCLLQRTVQGRQEHGWSWNWPGYEPSVFAYPEIVFGWRPWSGGKPTDPRFPLKLASIEQLSLHYHVETEATGSPSRKRRPRWGAAIEGRRGFGTCETNRCPQAHYSCRPERQR